MNPKQPVKKPQNIHEERARGIKKAEDNIQTVLNSAKANPKFLKLLKYSLNSLDRLITPPGVDVRLNKKVILQLDGVAVLKGLAMQNLKNEEIVTQIAEIIYKLLNQETTFDFELAKIFCEKGGHEVVIEILLSKEVGPGSLPLIKILNGLVGVPSLVNKLLDSGLAETVKLVNDLYADDLSIIEINFDTMKKVSNQKNGRDFLIEKNLVPNIIQNMKKCSESKNNKAVQTAFVVLDNLTKTPKGIEAIKMENALENLSEVIAHFETDDSVLAIGTKVMTKVAKPEDLNKYLAVITDTTMKVKTDPQIATMRTLEQALEIVGTLMLIDDIGKYFDNPDEIKKLLDEYTVINSIDLTGKNDKFIKTIMDLQKNFMIIFQRLFNSFPEVYDKISEKGRICSLYMDMINTSLPKNWNVIKSTAESLPKDNAEGAERSESYHKHFQDFFSSYAELFMFNLKETMKKTPAENDLGEVFPKTLTTTIADIISNGKTYFSKNEKSNLAASRLLKTGAELTKSLPNAKVGIHSGLLSSYPYIKDVIGTSNAIKTLNNDTDVIQYLINNNDGSDRNKKLKDDILPVIAKFMEEKPQFRYANNANLSILDGYFTPEIIDAYLHKNNPKENPIHGIDFVDSIVSVQSTSEEEALKMLYPNEEERNAAPRNEELEKQIDKSSTDLIKKLVDANEYKKKLKEFIALSQSMDLKNSNSASDLKLKKAAYFQSSSMNAREFFKIGSKDDLEAVKALLKKELFYIEQFKRDKANENNPKFFEIVEQSSGRMKTYCDLLKKIGSKSIQNYQDTKEAALVPQLQDVLLVNCEVLDKSSDTPNLVGVLGQMRKAIPFYVENEGLLKGTKPNENLLEKMVNSMNNLLRKSVDDDKIDDALIAACTTLVKKHPEASNLFVKAGCPRILVQVLDATSSPIVAEKAAELLKLITLSNDGNLQVVANQNILPKLFEIRAKFATEEEVVPQIDALTCELAKLPAQEEFINQIIEDALTGFHAVLQTDLSQSDNKHKELGHLQTLNALSNGPKQMETIAKQPFLADLHKSIEITNKDPEASQLTDNILMNEMALLKKVRDNLPNNEDEATMSAHVILADDVIMVMNSKAIGNPEIFITNLRMLNSYCNKATHFDRLVKKSVNPEFIDLLMETRDTYVENKEVAQEVNDILRSICIRYPEMREVVVSKGGIGAILDEIRAAVNMNDENGKATKLNGLKMLEPLLQDDKNMDEFLKLKGIKLINDLIKNELSISPPIPSDKDYYMTRDTLNVKTIEELKEIEREKVNSGEAKFKGDKDDNYFVYVLKVMQNGISKGQKEFSDDKIIKNISKLAEANYPNRFLFTEAANILTNGAVNISDADEQDNAAILTVALDNQVHYYKDKDIKSRVKKIEDLIVPKTLTKEKYKQNYTVSLKYNCNKDGNVDNLSKMATYASQLLKLKEFDEVFDANAEQFVGLYNTLVKQLKTQAEEQKPLPKTDSGTVISMMKLANYLIKKGKISKDNKGIIDDVVALGKPMYRPDNYNYVKDYNKEMGKLIDFFGKKAAGAEESEEPKFSAPYKAFFTSTLPKANGFLVDHYQNQKKDTSIVPVETKKKREKNLGKVLDNCVDFYTSEPVTENADIKAAEAQKLAVNILNIFDQVKKEPVSPQGEENLGRMKLLFNILGKILEQDTTNKLMDDIPFLKGAIDDTFEGINTPTLKLNEPMMRKIPLAIALKKGQNEEIGAKLLQPTSNDLVKNDNDKTIKANDIEILATLSNNPSNSKSMIKSNDLWEKLKSYYANDTDMWNRKNLATIMKNATNSNYNTEDIINNDPKSIGILLDKIVLPASVLTNKEDAPLAKKEIDVAVNILKDANNVKAIMSKGIKTQDELLGLAQPYKNVDPNLTKELEEQLDMIKKSGKSASSAEGIKADQATLDRLTVLVDANYKKHMDDLDTMGKGQLVNGQPPKTDNRKDKGRLSIITSTILYNTNNDKIASKLSWKNNEEMGRTIPQIIAAIRKLYNELRDPENAEDTQLNKQREELIRGNMTLLKKLSLAPDNHKEICEAGLLSFMDKVLQQPDVPILISLGSKDILKNCSHSESAVAVIVDNNGVIEKLVDEVLYFYNNPNVINESSEKKQTFICDNITFHNLCRSPKGFQAIFEKIGIKKLLEIGKVCTDVDLLEAIVGMLINYLQNTPYDTIPNDIFIDIIGILDICYNYKSKTPSLIAKAEKLTSLIYIPQFQDRIDKIGIIPRIDADFNAFKVEKEYVDNTLQCFGVITKDRPVNAKECLNNQIISKLQKEVTDSNHTENEDLIQHLTGLYLSLVTAGLSNDLIVEQKDNEALKKQMEKNKADLKVNAENLDKFNELLLGDNTIFWLDTFQPKVTQKELERSQKEATILLDDSIRITRDDGNKDKDKTKEKKPLDAQVEIVNNAMAIINIVFSTNKRKASAMVIGKLSMILFKTIKDLADKDDDASTEALLVALRSLATNLKNDESGSFIKSLNLQQLLELLQNLQKKHYANPLILSPINDIAGSVIKNITDRDFIPKFFDLINQSTKCQDWNPEFIEEALKVMYDPLVKHPFLIDEVFEDLWLNIYSILKLFKSNPEIQAQCYKILALFGKNKVYSYAMFNNSGLLETAKESLDNVDFNDFPQSKTKVRTELFKLLNSCCNSESNAKEISDVLMSQLLSELNEGPINEEKEQIMKLIWGLLQHKESIQAFIQYNGLDQLIKILNENKDNVDVCLDTFGMLSCIANAGEDYKIIMQEKQLVPLINEIIDKNKQHEKRIEFEGRGLIFLINSAKIKLEQVDEIEFTELKIENPIKASVRNFLTSGKQLKIVNQDGDVKPMQLQFSGDFLKVFAKEPELLSQAPKLKYSIDTIQIKQIIKGFATPNFKKISIFKSNKPKPECSFAIIGPATVDGVKSLSVYCKTETECNHWLDNMEIVIDHLKKNKTIKTGIIIKKKI